MINKDGINSFLHYGYLPFPSEKQKARIVDWDMQLHAKYSLKETNKNETGFVEEGVIALKNIFSNIENGTHIVPLSGGLDSRTVLGGLLHAGLKDQIIAVTFGTPGTYDFEIAQMLAKRFQLKHRIFDLTKVKLNQWELERTAASDNSWTFLFDKFFNYQICNKHFGKECIYWSGFLGDALSNAHLPKDKSLNWEDAKRFFSHQNRLVRSIKLTSPGYNPVDVLPDKPLVNSRFINFDLLLDLIIRQECYIRNVVTSNNYDYRIPFQDSNWINFILSVPSSYQKHQNIYKKIILKSFPELFSLPIANNYGFPLNKNKNIVSIRYLYERIRFNILDRFPIIGDKFLVNKYTNYIDFNHALRHRNNFKKTIFRNIQDLKLRKIVDWLDLDLIIKDHQNRNRNHGMALMLLAALEINLKAD